METLLEWFATHGRSLPWRLSRDPYCVLVSEIMLQQTQVSRVTAKYDAWMREFPTIHALAKAPRKNVLALWQGLGYNNRAVRLHTLANVVVHEHNGILPDSYDALLALPGIGPYTAGAIMIFAHDRVAPSVDVNIARIISRWAFPATKTIAKKELTAAAVSFIRKHPHTLQSALMDLGSAHCTATNPLCDSCPLVATCKTRGVRSDEQRVKQSTFVGSTRWYRGRILKAVLTKACTQQELMSLLEPKHERKFTAALNGLVQDGVLKKKETTYSVH